MNRGNNWRQTGFIGFSAAALAIAVSAPVMAADLGGNCCADLEERIAELEATTARKGNRKVSLTVSGLVHESILFWDDGYERNQYVTTNEFTQTRFRFLGEAKISGDWKAGYLLEIGVRGARGDRVNQNDDNGGTTANSLSVRHSTWYIANKNYGKVWVGQTSDAADGVTETNLGGNGFFTTASWGNSFGDGGSGFNLRRKSDAGSTGVQWGDFGTQGLQQGVPGEGHRLNVIKYDTPAIAGFTASASWGDDDVWALGLRYSGEISGFKLAGAAGYISWNDFNTAADNRGAGETQEFGLSASVLHVATGLYVTGAWGHLEDDGLAPVYAALGQTRAIDDETEFYFLQGGIQKKFLPIGTTTIFGEYFNLERGAGFVPAIGGGGSLTLAAGALGAGTLTEVAGSEIRGWGIGINQNLSEVVDVYVGYRHVSVDVITTNGAGTASVLSDLEDFDYVTAGAQVKF